MSESALADSILEIENQIIVVIWTGPHRDCIEMHLVAHLPGDHVIGARGVTAQSEAADNLAVAGVQRQPASKYNYSADRLAGHRIIRRSEGRRIAEHREGIWRRRGRQAVQALPG